LRKGERPSGNENRAGHDDVSASLLMFHVFASSIDVILEHQTLKVMGLPDEQFVWKSTHSYLCLSHTFAGSLPSILLTLVDSVEDIFDRIVVRRDVATIKFFSMQCVQACRVILQMDENASFYVM